MKKRMCKTLCELQETEFCQNCKGFSDKIYDVEQWKKDWNFNALPMQEISEDVYFDFLGSLPPLPIPKSLGMCGFMNSEPYTHATDNKGRFTAFYNAFGNIDKKYYYLGLANKYGEKTSKQS